MAEKIFKFTKSRIEGLPAAPKGGRVEYRDTEIQGLILRVTAGGIKTFSVSRKKKGEHFRVTLGRFPDLSVDNARIMALKALGEMSMTRKNPNDLRKQEEKRLITLQEAFEERLKVRGHRISQTTADQYRGLLTNYSGDWMPQPMIRITRENIEKRHKAITDGDVWFGGDRAKLRSGVGGGSKSQADAWGRAIRAVFRFAWDHYRDDEGRSLLPEPPTMVLSTKAQWHGLVRKTERVRNTDLGRWFAAIELVRLQAAENRDDFAHAVCDAIYMAMFTGLRKSEILQLEWNRVNILALYFWIDKTKNGDPLELPIIPSLLKMFRRRLSIRKGDEPYVFPGKNGGVIGESRKVIKRIVAATVPVPNPDDLPPVNFKYHDARRTFGSAAALAGLGHDLIKRLLNHKTLRSADVTEGYLYFGADELQEHAEKVEGYILEKAGLVENKKGIDLHLITAMEALSEEEKRKLLFSLLNNSEVSNK
ncbi:integrase family protein [Salmonella enterica subsp. enterica]|nr:integrase family protein [Salmonella enterica subsp. enterica]